MFSGENTMAVKVGCVAEEEFFMGLLPFVRGPLSIVVIMLSYVIIRALTVLFSVTGHAGSMDS